MIAETPLWTIEYDDYVAPKEGGIDSPLWCIEYDDWRLEVFEESTRYVDLYEEIAEVLHGWWP